MQDLVRIIGKRSFSIHVRYLVREPLGHSLSPALAQKALSGSTVPFLRVQEMQDQLVARLKTDSTMRSHAELWLCQFEPVYTLGRRQKSPENIEQSVPVVQTRRGGLTTFHGPGQLVAYPILPLASTNLSLRDYVSGLEDTVIATCREFGIHADRSPQNHVGVFCGPDLTRKLAFVGIQASRGIVSSGLSINVDPDLNYFAGIDYCGLASAGVSVTSICKELHSDATTIANVAPVLVDHFCATFKCTLVSCEVLGVGS